MASFVSARDISAAKALKKQEKKIARSDILKQAKTDHEQRTRRKELREQTGEDEWMAPGLMSRFSDDTTSHTRKKHKKDNKKKKHSKHTDHHASSSESKGDVWVEKGRDSDSQSDPTLKTNKAGKDGTLQRETWMTAPMEPSHKSLLAIEDLRKSSQVKEQKSNEAVSALQLIFACRLYTVYLLIYRTAKNNYFGNCLGIIGTDFYRACEVSGIIITNKQLHAS